MLEERSPEEMAALDRFAAVTLKYLLSESQLGHLLESRSSRTVCSVTESVMRSSAEKAYDMAEAMLSARFDRNWQEE